MNDYDEKNEKVLKMFDNSRNHINEEIACIIISNGEEIKLTGKLIWFSNYNWLQVGDYGVQFIGVNCAIKEVILKSTNEVLYKNDYISLTYKGENELEILNEQRNMFGHKYVFNKNSLKSRDQSKVKYDDRKEIAIKKLRLMRQGVIELEPLQADEWTIYVNENGKSLSTLRAIEAALSLIKEIDSGIPFENMEYLKLYAEEYRLRSDYIITIINTVSKFSSKGQEFKKYCENSFGISNKTPDFK